MGGGSVGDGAGTLVGVSVGSGGVSDAVVGVVGDGDCTMVGRAVGSSNVTVFCVGGGTLASVEHAANRRKNISSVDIFVVGTSMRGSPFELRLMSSLYHLG